MDVIILAGGRGTRLSTAVPDLPKPMAPVAGQPFLSYLLAMLTAQGVERICLSVGYMAEAIERYFGSSFGAAKITYAREQSPLGTGGAIRAALSETQAGDVFVLNGDTIAQVDLQNMFVQHRACGSPLSAALTWVGNCGRYGKPVVVDGRIERFSEKGESGSGYINAGVYLLQRDIFDSFPLPSVFSFETEMLIRHLRELSPQAFLSQGYFIDIGVPKDYERAQHELPAWAAREGFSSGLSLDSKQERL